MRRAVRPADLPVLCLTIAACVSGLIILAHVSHLTFISDEWDLLLNRRDFSPDDLLSPFHEHIVLGPAIVWNVLRGVFGMDSALPFQIAATLMFLLSAVLLFLHLRSRIGAWPALLAAILILFLGAAFEDLLFAFQIGFYGSVAAGLGMLIALDRGDQTGDRIACGLLIVSLAFSSVGLAFAAGALVDLALNERPWRGRLFVALLPLELYALWWLGWGHTAENHLSMENLRGMPEYAFKAAAAGITSLLGLATGDGSEPDQPHLIYGELLLVAGVGLGILRLRQLGRFPRDLAIVLAIGLAFWVLAGIDRSPVRFATSSRYQYPSAVFLLLIAAELLRGIRIRTPAVVVAGLVTAWAISGGMPLLYREYHERWLPSSDSTRVYLAAVEIAANHDPSYPVVLGSVTVTPRTYLSAVEADGSPAYSESELLSRPEGDRVLVDNVLVIAEDVGLGSSPADSTDGGNCESAEPGSPPGYPLQAGAFRLTNESTSELQLSVGRFSDGFPSSLGSLLPGASAMLAIPADGSARPWHLGVAGDGTVRICPAPAPGA
jgi:hypothetical protein